VFGWPTYYHIDDGKFEHGSRKGMFVGYKNGLKDFIQQLLSDGNNQYKHCVWWSLF